MNLDAFSVGCLSGIIQTIIGHPFDTFKTWKQNSQKLKIPKTNLNNLYKGMTYPLLQYPTVCSITFGVDNYIYSYTSNRLLSSSTAGLISCFFISPLEYFKIQYQQQINTKLTKKIIKESFKDINITIIREIPANIVYFSSYNYFREKNISIHVSGGLSGVFSWLLTYPSDTIKSRLQSGKADSFIAAWRQGNIWNGLSICLLRAYIVNSSGFTVFEYFIK